MTGLNHGLIAAFAGLAMLGSAHAAPPPQVAQCAGCHGANGMGNAAAGFPALAGQSPQYLEDQLYAFKVGTRRNAIMKSFADGLDKSQRAAIAAYYHGLPVVASAAAATAPTNDTGAKLAMQGAATGTSKAIPACTSCHGAGGMGQGPAFPRLAGQPAQYLENQLTDWQSGSRNESNLHLMGSIARNLSAKQIKAVAAYFAALPAKPQG